MPDSFQAAAVPTSRGRVPPEGVEVIELSDTTEDAESSDEDTAIADSTAPRSGDHPIPHDGPDTEHDDDQGLGSHSEASGLDDGHKSLAHQWASGDPLVAAEADGGVREGGDEVGDVQKPVRSRISEQWMQRWVAAEKEEGQQPISAPERLPVPLKQHAQHAQQEQNQRLLINQRERVTKEAPKSLAPQLQAMEEAAAFVETLSSDASDKDNADMKPSARKGIALKDSTGGSLQLWPEEALKQASGSAPEHTHTRTVPDHINGSLEGGSSLNTHMASNTLPLSAHAIPQQTEMMPLSKGQGKREDTLSPTEPFNGCMGGNVAAGDINMPLSKKETSLSWEAYQESRGGKANGQVDRSVQGDRRGRNKRKRDIPETIPYKLARLAVHLYPLSPPLSLSNTGNMIIDFIFNSSQHVAIIRHDSID